jgi:hypothetical protein
MQMLGPNNDVPSRIKIKYSYPKTRKELGIPDQQKQTPVNKSSRYAYFAAVYKALPEIV